MSKNQTSPVAIPGKQGLTVNKTGSYPGKRRYCFEGDKESLLVKEMPTSLPSYSMLEDIDPVDTTPLCSGMDDSMWKMDD